MIPKEDYGIPYRKGVEIRDTFLKFFQERQHQVFPSASIAPKDDPTLLFTNAGMNQFKAIFLGDNRAKLKRVVDTQKCLRVSGKHNDLDEVGMDGRHHTFFEMLGNWSFGDYYKKEAIQWAWELLTDVFKIPKNRLFVTVYKDDNEAFELWKTTTDIEASRIMRFDKENFWEMGATGPCGPCSEIHFDSGLLSTQAATFKDPVHGVNGTNDRYVEIWNLVFMQYERQADSSLQPLKDKHVDTGAGFERLCAVIQNKSSNYETDLFAPIIEKISKLSQQPIWNADGSARVSHQVIADHIRTLVFAIADGVTPGNEGRAYVIRRILRRASRFAHDLGQKEPFLYKLVACVVELMGHAFPEIKERQNYIEQVIVDEETRFLKTLGQGLARLHKTIDKLKDQKQDSISGDDAFLLHDTFGFPIDLTQAIAREQGLKVDEESYHRCMQEQQDRARLASKFDTSLNNDEAWTILKPSLETQFRGYETLSTPTSVTRYREDKDFIFLMLDQTPFYAEAGGQIGDVGVILGKDIELKVVDTFKGFERQIHKCTLTSGLLRPDTLVTLTAHVDERSRFLTARNHSATHLLHAALRKHLGEHVKQQGSYVGPDRLRFDFTHPQKITADEIKHIEDLVNHEILNNAPIKTEILSTQEAEKSGAMALFGEKYGDKVRVLSMGDFSKELCGGTHCRATGDIGLFKITSESSIASGVRRIEGLTALGFLEKTREDESKLAAISSLLKSKPEEALDRIERLKSNFELLQNELQVYKQNELMLKIKQILKQPKHGSMFLTSVSDLSKDKLGSFLDLMQSELPLEAVCLLTHTEQEQSTLMIVCGKNAVMKYKANELIKRLCVQYQGRGGGRPERAQGVFPVAEAKLLPELETFLLNMSF